MEFLNSIPEWLGSASAAVLMLITIVIGTRFLQSTIIPFLKDLNDDRRRLAEEQRTQREQILAEYRELYEGRVMPTMKTLTDSLTNALEVQRVQYEGKLTMLENERNIERAKLVEQIAQLTEQIRVLSAELKDLRERTDAEIKDLKTRLQAAEHERDNLKAQLAAFDLSQPTPSADGHGQAQPKETTP